MHDGGLMQKRESGDIHAAVNMKRGVLAPNPQSRTPRHRSSATNRSGQRKVFWSIGLTTSNYTHRMRRQIPAFADN